MWHSQSHMTNTQRRSHRTDAHTRFYKPWSRNGTERLFFVTVGLFAATPSVLHRMNPCSTQQKVPLHHGGGSHPLLFSSVFGTSSHKSCIFLYFILMFMKSQ